MYNLSRYGSMTETGRESYMEIKRNVTLILPKKIEEFA